MKIAYVLMTSLSDGGLAPVNQIAVFYRKWANKKSVIAQFGYGTTYRNLGLRETTASYLNETRGLDIS